MSIFLLSIKTKHKNLSNFFNFKNLSTWKPKRKKKKSIKIFSPRQNFEPLKTYDPYCILQEYAKKTQNVHTILTLSHNWCPLWCPYH